MMTAQQFFNQRKFHGSEHADYMDFAEMYADYVCHYEKNEGISINANLNRIWNARPQI